MSRHTLNDGLTSDPTILPRLYDMHWPELAPNVVGKWYRGEISWEEFAKRYHELLQNEPARSRLLELVDLAKVMNVTVLCTEDDPTYCHRRLLALCCKQLDSTLEVSIR